MRPARILAALALAVGVISTATAFAAPANTRATSIRASLRVLTDPNQAAGRFGYVLMEAQSGKVLAGRNADDLFIPASLSKIPTSLIALTTLGKDQRIETRVMAEGVIVDGVLQGDLHLVGGGDPSLTIRDMENLAARLAGSGLREVGGRFTFDASALPRSTMIEPAQFKGHHYNPAISGLNVDLNLRTKSGRRFPVSEPGHRAAMMLRYFAYQYGVTMPEPVRQSGASGGQMLAVHRSAPMAQLIANMMDRSTNLTAEALGALAIRASGTNPKSLAHAANVTSRWLKSQIGSIGGKGWTGFRMVNHSGLSTRSRATPRQIASILRLGYQKFGTQFTALHKKTEPAGYQAYTLRGKFGTMRFVRGYSGFLTIGGRDMVFAIMTNNDRRRQLANAGKKGLRGPAWMNMARRLEHRVLSNWIEDHWPRTASR